MKRLTLAIIFFLLVVANNQSALYLDDQTDNSDYMVSVKREPTIDSLMTHYFGDVKVAAYKVFNCESGMNPKATHVNSDGSTDRGLAQVNSVHVKKVNGDLDSLYIPKVNIRVARQIYDASGSFSPWTCKYVLD